MDYQVKMQSIPDRQVLSFRYTGRYEEMEEYLHLLFDLAKERVNGAPFSLCYEVISHDEMDLEVCLPVSEEIGVSEPFQNKIIAGGEFVTTLQKGSDRKLSEGYHALENYLTERNVPIGTPSRATYLTGFGSFEKNKATVPCIQMAIPLPVKRNE